MSTSADDTRPSRRVFLLGGAGFGLAAGAVVGWLAARGLPFVVRNDRGVELSPSEQAVLPIYSNFARVTSTAEEVILDFCLNPNPFAVGKQELKVAQRVIINFATAKELFEALGKTLQEHEKAHGTIELDIKKRVKPGGLRDE